MNLVAACTKQQPLCFPFVKGAGASPDIQDVRGQGQHPHTPAILLLGPCMFSHG